MRVAKEIKTVQIWVNNTVIFVDNTWKASNLRNTNYTVLI